MFIYLAKKIEIPQGRSIESISWNSEQGWIACGGGNGLLKVLKLEARTGKRSLGPSNLSMNQTLEGHTQNVCVVTWNENYRKLTTSDQCGLIIVWMLHKGQWYEEMINNRNKSVVNDMKWTADGQKICIIYQDGAVIVGSVDGNRLWGKELHFELQFVEWSPSGQHILFGGMDGTVHLYDNMGNCINEIPIYANTKQNARLVGLEWYKDISGYQDPTVPSLAICFHNGRCQIMRDDTDDNPILIDTGITSTQMKWNTKGNMLAIAGTKTTTFTNDGPKETQVVTFWDQWGKHLRSLEVRGSGITSLSWEGGSLRLAISVDSFIYFANIRPKYEWGYFSNTLVYSFTKPERPEHCVGFWDIVSDQRHIKYIKQLIAIRAAGENCIFATRADDSSGQYILILCNAIGSPVDSKYIDIQPIYLALSPYHVVVASTETVHVWQYRTAGSRNKANRRQEGREVIFHIDDLPQNNTKNFQNINRETADPICAVGISNTTLIIGRESGTIMRYSLPRVQLENRYIVRCRTQVIKLNCNSTRIGIIDINGAFTLFDLDARPEGPKGPVGERLAFDRKDVWDMTWSEDNPELFAIMEKTRMYVFRGLSAEEPVISSAYLCEFKELCIKAVLMDDIIRDPEHPDRDLIVHFETKSLRDTRALLRSVPIAEAFQFIEDNPHPRLWRILAESALENLNLSVADKAFVRCQDYQGIQFVKRLRLLKKTQKQKAEVNAYFKRFDEAEEIYLRMGEKDLAVELRTRLGDWFRVVQLIKMGGGDDKLLEEAYNNIGYYYSDRQKWHKAFSAFQTAGNLEQQVNCAYILDDYDALKSLVDQIPERTKFLGDVGAKFMSVGLCHEAVSAFLRAGDPKAAIDCCVLLNQWDLAVKLAEEHNFQEISDLLIKYATHLLSKNKLFQAVELYRKANKHTEAGTLLCQLGKEVGTTKSNPLRAKQLYVLAALEVDKYRHSILARSNGGTLASTEQALESLLIKEHPADERIVEDPWHGAEAYHFWLLAQRQLYSKERLAESMRTSLLLKEYDDVLDEKDVYSLIALTTFYNGYYGQCSRAFIKLEALQNLTDKEREKYQKTSLEIFIDHRPVDPKGNETICPAPNCRKPIYDWFTSCHECSRKFPACIVTGRPIQTDDNNEIETCRHCKHKAYRSEISKFEFCPLCHSPRFG